MNSPIQAVSLDAGGTLIEPWPSVGHVYAAVACEMGIAGLDAAKLNADFIAAWRAKHNFGYSRAEWADLVVNTLGRSVAEVGLGSALFERLYARFVEATAWRIYPDVFPTLNLLRAQGLRLTVISNWDDRLRPLLRNLELDGWFHSIEISGESGFHKPSPRIFQRAVESLGLTPAEVLHVGDSLEEDYRGAKAAGLPALWLRRGTQVAAPDEITSLTELPALLESRRLSFPPDLRAGLRLP
jgi:putative hydrolase of the HAD superfamily